MLTDFERKLVQIVRNDRAMGRITNITDWNSEQDMMRTRLNRQLIN